MEPLDVLERFSWRFPVASHRFRWVCQSKLPESGHAFRKTSKIYSMQGTPVEDHAIFRKTGIAFPLVVRILFSLADEPHFVHLSDH